MADAIKALQIEDPRAAGTLLLGAYRAGTSLAKALDAAQAMTSSQERVLAREAIAQVMGHDLQSLVDRIISLHPEFDVDSWDELKERLWTVGVDPDPETADA